MGFWIFILLLTLFFWALPRIMAYVMQRRARKFFDNMFGGSQQADGGRRQQQQTYERPKPRRKSKKIDPDVGEYVDFEEISGASSTTTETSQVCYTAESQIEDAEWEEVS